MRLLFFTCNSMGILTLTRPLPLLWSERECRIIRTKLDLNVGHSMSPGDPLRFHWNLFRMMICRSIEHMQNIKIILHAVFEIWSFEICLNSRKVKFWNFPDFRMPYFQLRTRQRAENWYSYLLFAKFNESAVRFNVSSLDFKLWLSKVGSRISDIFFGQFLGSPRMNTRGYMGPILPEYDLWAQVYIRT